MDHRKVGDTVPETVLHQLQQGQLTEVNTRDIFAGQRVIVFSLPGAFTPTCSSSHLPRYNALAPVFKRLGFDRIVCLSVNDAFVMDAWAKDQDAEHVTLLADGNGAFSAGMGLLVDKSDLGFGKRSWRYSMAVNDGRIEHIFVEPQEPGDPFKVSDADTMLAAVAPDERLANITLFTKAGCSHCTRAKEALVAAGRPFEEVSFNRGFSERSLANVTGKTATPQVYIDGQHIGGADELVAWLAQNPVQ